MDARKFKSESVVEITLFDMFFHKLPRVSTRGAKYPIKTRLEPNLSDKNKFRIALTKAKRMIDIFLILAKARFINNYSSPS